MQEGLQTSSRIHVPFPPKQINNTHTNSEAYKKTSESHKEKILAGRGKNYHLQRSNNKIFV